MAYRKSASAITGSSLPLLFAGMFFFSCILFWWTPSLIFTYLLGVTDPVNLATIQLSMVAVLCFMAGFFGPQAKKVYLFKLSKNQVSAVGQLAGHLTRIIGPVSVATALYFFFYRSGIQYGEGEGLATWQQAIFYFHLFTFTLYLSTTDDFTRNRGRWFLTVMISIIPRFIVSLAWGRFFFAQALVPLLLLAVARGWVKVNAKTLIGLALCALAIIFVPPAMRGDALIGNEELISFLVNGSTLLLFQNNMETDFSQACAPLLVSLTAKLVPYELLGVCTIDIWGQTGLPATLDRLLAYQEIGGANLLVGPGSNFLLELYVTGKVPAVIAGSLAFGYSCRFFCKAIAVPTVFGAIWLECLTRALFAPRSNLGYVFERIPSLMIVTMLFVAIALSVHTVRYRGRKRGQIEVKLA